MTTSSSDRESDGNSIENPECYRKRETGVEGCEGDIRDGEDISCVDLPRMEGMNLRRDVRAGVQRRRRKVHGYPEPRSECPHPISIRLEDWRCVYSWPATWSIPTDGRSREVIAVEFQFTSVSSLCFSSRSLLRIFARRFHLRLHCDWSTACVVLVSTIRESPRVF